MTTRQKILTGWAAGGVLALAVSNLFLRYLESNTPKPMFVSAKTKERLLRELSATQGCSWEEVES